MQKCKVCRYGNLSTGVGKWRACDKCGTIYDSDYNIEVIPADARLTYHIELKIELGIDPLGD